MKTPQEMHDLYEAEYLEVYDYVWAVARIPESAAVQLGLKEKALKRLRDFLDKILLEGYGVLPCFSFKDSSVQGAMFVPLTKKQHQKVLETWKKKQEERKEQESGLSI